MSLNFSKEFLDAINRFFEGRRRLVILGIGNELNGDDAVGLYTVKLIINTPLPEWVNVFYCEKAPEHFLGKIAKIAPNRVIVIDAADMNAPPGAIAILPRELIWDGFSFSTHTLSLKLLEEFLAHETDINDFKLLFIGIQPKQMFFDTSLSPECKNSAEELAELIIKKIKEDN